jgi:hypothetical protein
MKFDYAQEAGLPTIAFVHSNGSAMPFGKSESDSEFARG